VSPDHNEYANFGGPFDVVEPAPAYEEGKAIAAASGNLPLKQRLRALKFAAVHEARARALAKNPEPLLDPVSLRPVKPNAAPKSPQSPENESPAVDLLSREQSAPSGRQSSMKQDPPRGMSLIDRPGHFDSAETWERHLQFLGSLPDNIDNKQLEIEDAEEALRQPRNLFCL
jgi:hypothetical protein